MQAEELRLDQPPEAQRGGYPNRQPQKHEHAYVLHHQPQYIARDRAQRYADADLGGAPSHGVSHHAIQSDGRQDGGQQSEGARQNGDQPVNLQGFLHLHFNRRHVKYRQTGIHLLHQAAHLRPQRVRITFSAHVEFHAIHLVLVGVRGVDGRARRLAQAGVFGVAHYADDLVVRSALITGAEHHAAAERVPLAEEEPHELFVHYHHFLGRGEVAFGDFPAARYRNTQRLEISWTDRVPRYIGVFVFTSLIAFHGDIAAARAVGKRTGAGGAGGDRSGQRRKPPLQVFEKGEAAGRRVTV